jgi:hypothetical protein
MREVQLKKKLFFSPTSSILSPLCAAIKLVWPLGSFEKDKTRNEKT